MRSSYLILLEIITTSPLSHGAGAVGNEQQLRTTDVLLRDPEAMAASDALTKRETVLYGIDVADARRRQREAQAWRRVKVPVVSGAAVKATLREHATADLCEILGLGDGQVSRDKLRLLAKGGKNESNGQSVSLEEMRRMRDLFPSLAVFGSMDGGLPIRGEIRVSPARPWCSELVDAGLLPRVVCPVAVQIEGQPPASGMEIAVFDGLEPVPLHLVRSREEYFRHDMQTSPLRHLLEGPAQAQIEEKRAELKTQKQASKTERRDANESMPHAHQVIATGTPMVVEIRLQGATDVEFGCLARALLRWAATGGHLGGGISKGHGACKIRIAGAVEYQPKTGEGAMLPGSRIDSLDAPEATRQAAAYVAHVLERGAQIRTEVACG